MNLSPVHSTDPSNSPPPGAGLDHHQGAIKPAPTSQLPEIHEHELLHPIGRGAYGEVWLARNALGGYRAVKIVYRDHFDTDRPFEREFAGIQKFEPISRSHPGLVHILQVGRRPDFFYYVMELADPAVDDREALAVPFSSETQITVECSLVSVVSGNRPAGPGCSPGKTPSGSPYAPRTLREELRRNGRLPPGRCVEVGLALASALSHLHTNGLVHRDIKPSNIIFVDGAPKLADIGLVTDVGDSQSIVGTEGYLPPEGPGTPQSDIFSLGKVLYEITTGQDRRLFPNLPSDLRDWPDAPGVLELNEVVLKACASHCRDRYSNAEAMCRDLARLADQKSVRRNRQMERRWRFLWRCGAWLAAAAAFVALIHFTFRIKRPLRPEHDNGGSTNELANQSYRLGKNHFDVFDGANMALASDYFQRAIQQDPNFAEAYSGLAETCFWGGMDDWNPRWEKLPQAKGLALRALELKPSLAEPHLALGAYSDMLEWDWKKAESEMRKATELSPQSPFCHLCYAELLKMKGDMPRALEQIGIAKDLDRHSRIINIRLIYFYINSEQFTNALKQIEQYEALFGRDFGLRRVVYRALGRFDDALEAERQAAIQAHQSISNLDSELNELKQTLHRERSPRAFWCRELEKAKKEGDPYTLACFHSQLGDTTTALDLLEKAADERNVWLTFMVKTDWMLDPIRHEPRFKAVLRRMNFE